ncbi:MAG: MBL fold metallo-hydrolase [Acidimicrobiales bacterium]
MDPGRPRRCTGLDAIERLAQGFGPPFFPIRPDELRGRWRFHAPEAGPVPVAVEATRVVVGPVLHKGGPTVGVRVERAGRTFAYLPDHCIGRATAAQLDQAKTLCRDVDVLFHDAQHLEAERAMADDFGHCTVGDAVDLAASAGAHRLVLVHHAPGRDDRAVDTVLAEAGRHARRWAPDLRVQVGREGEVVPI